MSKKDKTLYTENSIITLNPRDFTRLRPATYLGSNEYSTQLVREVFSNSLDEHIIGHGDIINVSINTKENKYTVGDNGQGFPINVVKDGETILRAAFDRLNTSGKYSDDGVYQGASLGLNGIGSKLTNFLSKRLNVITYRDNQFEKVSFTDGIYNDGGVGKSDHKPGTIVEWVPDPQFFQNANANVTDLNKLFEDISALCPQLTINFTVDNKTTTYHSANGLQDLVDKKVKDKEILSNRFYVRRVDGNNLFDICLTYTTDYSDSMTAYVNYGLTESGDHIYHLKASFTREVNKYAEANNLLKKNDDKLTSNELSEGLTIVFNLKTTGVKYDSQTKTRLVDFDKSLMTTVMTNDFADWLNNNPKDAKLIIDRALLARKAKDAAQKAKDKIREAKTGKKFISLPSKLVDCFSKDRSECELHITEGDSAANGIIAKRDGKTQAVFPIRGKILSCRKATPDKVYANQEISNIVKALGLDIDKETGKLIYDKRKLRYGKVVIDTDADPDGAQIRLLLINMFWWLCPDLVVNEHIAASVPPLFRITTSKNEYIYLVDDKALANYKKVHKKESYKVNRMKGLGECDPTELAQLIIKPETRNVQTITVADVKAADEMLECFMGDKVDPRREYLLEHYNDVSIDVE